VADGLVSRYFETTEVLRKLTCTCLTFKLYEHVCVFDIFLLKWATLDTVWGKYHYVISFLLHSSIYRLCTCNCMSSVSQFAFVFLYWVIPTRKWMSYNIIQVKTKQKNSCDNHVFQGLSTILLKVKQLFLLYEEKVSA
jgi:hypothetical protein